MCVEVSRIRRRWEVASALASRQRLSAPAADCTVPKPRPAFGHIQSPSINCFREVAADIIRAEGAIVRPSHLRSGHGDKAHSEITSTVSEAAHCTRPRWRRCSFWGLSGLGFVVKSASCSWPRWPKRRYTSLSDNLTGLAIATILACLCGCWWMGRANRKAKEPFAPPTSDADYCASFLWILTVVLGVAVAMISKYAHWPHGMPKSSFIFSTITLDRNGF